MAPRTALPGPRTAPRLPSRTPGSPHAPQGSSLTLVSARLPRTEAAPELRQHRSAPRTGLDRTGYKGRPSSSQRPAPAGIHRPLCPRAAGGGHRLSPGLRSFPSSRILPVTWSAHGGASSPRPSAEGLQAQPLLPAGSGRESSSPGRRTARVSEGLPDGQMDSPSPCYRVCPAVRASFRESM